MIFAAHFARLQATPLSQWLREDPLVYPVLEVVHILGFGLLWGTMFAVDLAVFRQNVRGLVERLLPLALGGFGVALIAGLLMILARPVDLVSNVVVWAKFGLIAVAGMNAWVFHWRGSLTRLDGLARMQALVSIALWAAVVFAGRWIAYA